MRAKTHLMSPLEMKLRPRPIDWVKRGLTGMSPRPSHSGQSTKPQHPEERLRTCIWFNNHFPKRGLGFVYHLGGFEIHQFRGTKELIPGDHSRGACACPANRRYAIGGAAAAIKEKEVQFVPKWKRVRNHQLLLKESFVRHVCATCMH